MAAPKKNQNNKIWTPVKINNFINKVYRYVKNQEDCCTLSQAILECGEYEQLLRYFKSLSKENKDINFAPIKKAKDIIKDRIIVKGLNNEYNPTMSIFILKNNHDMKDKTEVDQKVEIEKPLIIHHEGKELDL